ncbi:hypothetical protein K461DRAFT_290303 [Myriangium duriaei CBS 260.36]|uniref:Dienelactone hydrolase domain-containing protein n=1 Tax=Myriangium duriaei CBS 260.36 TaxID=1168546 RepID=A0A9P4JA08_9PEZI|nr:hypothetical protein K461DRAFT_290303 [Myriangium duriaei CBS 260.36]
MAGDDMEDIDVSSELTTRAPENDAEQNTNPAATATQSTTAGESAANPGGQQQSQAPQRAEAQNPTMGEHCVSDRPAPTDSKSKGEISTLGGIETYVSTPSSYPSEPAKLLLLLSPGTGIHSLNNQLQADLWAEKGFVVVMPDQFGGDPAPKLDAVNPDSTDLTKEQQPSESDETPAPAVGFLDRLKLGFLETAKSFRIDMWLARHTPATVLPALSSVLKAAEEVYADAVSYGDGIYGAGYCFGGRYALLLAGELPADVLAGQRDIGTDLGETTAGQQSSAGDASVKAEEGMVRHGPRLKAAVIAHATGVTKDDFAALRPGSRIAIAAVSDDALFADDVREFGVRTAKEKGVVVEERVWEGVPHGFAVVGEYKDQSIARAQSQAFDMMTRFLQTDHSGPASA